MFVKIYLAYVYLCELRPSGKSSCMFTAIIACLDIVDDDRVTIKYSNKVLNIVKLLEMID